MRTTFGSYYTPDKDFFDRLWTDGVFVLDANVLLNIYRYSTTTRRHFFAILVKLGNRIWVPHQSALEFHENRLVVISQQRDAYGQAIQILEGASNQINSKIGTSMSKHSYIDPDELTKPILKAITEQLRILKRRKSNHPKLSRRDPHLEKITDLLEGHVGSAYTDQEIAKRHKQAADRFKVKRPPGYKDENKPVPDRYGDVVLWFQILDRAKGQQQPVVLVTDDDKEDWWRQHEGQKLGPRPELIDEMRNDAGVDFWMYSSGRFIEYARDRLGLASRVSKESVEEAQEVSRFSPTHPELTMTSAFSPSSQDPYHLLELFGAMNRMKNPYQQLTRLSEQIAALNIPRMQQSLAPEMLRAFRLLSANLGMNPLYGLSSGEPDHGESSDDSTSATNEG